MSVPPRVRFAPSPTGSLHLGNARTALFNWLLARGRGGAFVLRVEDTDTERHRAGSERAILDDLKWLGLDWDEGPDVGGPYGPYRQSERLESYRAEAQRLVASGRAYRCFCSGPPSDADGAGEPDDRTGAPTADPCRRLSRSEADRLAGSAPSALRFAVRGDGDAPGPVTFVDGRRRVEVPREQLADPVLLRTDGYPTYHFAVVVDDAAMKIDIVLRGDDHLSNTPIHVLLMDALGYSRPEFFHVPMVRGSDGARLSKRHGAVSVAEYRRMGYPAEAVVNALALLGWSPGDDREILDRATLVREFDPGRVHLAPALFDVAKLDWIAGRHVREMPGEALRAAVGRSLAAAGLLPPIDGDAATAWLERLADALRSSIHRWDQVPERAAGLFYRGGAPADEEAGGVIDEPGAREVISALARAASGTTLDDEGWKLLKKRVGAETGQRGKALFRPLRVAITGQTSGLELDRLVPLIDTGHRLFPDRIAGVAERAARAAAHRP